MRQQLAARLHTFTELLAGGPASTVCGDAFAFCYSRKLCTELLKRQEAVVGR